VEPETRDNLTREASPKLFELSGENEDLAAAEVAAAAEAEDLSFEELNRFPGLLLAETGPAGRFGRLGSTHRVLRPVAELEHPSDYAPELRLSSTFSVRARRVRNSRKDLSLPEVERTLGSRLVEAGGEVDLDDPEIEFRAVLSGEKVFLGETLLQVDRSFAKTRPHERPFFHPGVVEPVTARAIVNLARARRRFLNPMCGTGSLLLEAARVGAEPTGLDADTEKTNGSRKNLDAESILGVFVTGDATSLPFRDASFDSAAADLPYGRSAKLYGDDLYASAVEAMERVLRKGCYIVVAAPRPLEGAAERYEQRVHRSLTRHLNVFEVER